MLGFEALPTIYLTSSAYIPYFGRNTKFQSFDPKPRILVLTKADLADPRKEKEVVKYYSDRGEHVCFMNTMKGNQEIRKLMKQVLTIADPQWLSRQPPSVNLLIAGMPNVGKSSLINCMRRALVNKANCATTGDRPGVTRHVQMKVQVYNSPPVFVLDTPGVMIPNLTNPDVAMLLAVIGTLRDELVGEELVAEYLLYTLNRLSRYEYTEVYGLEGPVFDLRPLLEKIAIRMGALFPGGSPHIQLAARYFIQRFRRGDFGRFSFLELPSAPTVHESYATTSPLHGNIFASQLSQRNEQTKKTSNDTEKDASEFFYYSNPSAGPSRSKPS